MKKVLVVAYHFPPSDAVGALRPAKFAEYLPEFGWEPVVLAGAEAGGRFAAEAVRTVRVAPWPGLRELWLRFKGHVGRDANGKKRGASEAAWQARFEEARRNRTPVIGLREFVYGLMALPDEHHGWIPPAVYRGLRLIEEERPDVLLATSPPHSAQLVGMLLGRMSGLPLAVDLRDPWIGNPATPDYVREGPTYGLHRWLEGRVMSAADQVITVTPEHAAELAARRPAHEAKIATIPNGFDASMFERLRCGGSDRFTITYVGNFYHRRSPRPLFDALSILIGRGEIDPANFEVRFVGDCEYAEGRPVLDMARQAGLNGSLSIVGSVPYREALQEVVRSDLLLLLATEQPRQVPTKAYEYLAAGRPVLALVEEGATARVMKDAGADVMVDLRPEEIAGVVGRRLAGWTPGEPTPWSCPPGAASYERRETARQLGALLDAVSGH